MKKIQLRSPFRTLLNSFRLKYFTNKVILLYIGILFLLGFLCVYRCFLGFDWSDETYYAALTHRLLIGDHLLIDLWDPHQFSALLTLPLVAFYEKLFGTTGIILFLRIAYVISSFLVGIYMFKVLRKRYSNFPSFICAGLSIVFVPFCISTFSYNTLALMFLTISSLLLIDASGIIVSRKSIKLILSGFIFALAVQSYPYVIMVLPVPLVFFLRRLKNEYHHCKWYKTSLVNFIFGLIIAFISFVFFFLITTPLSEAINNIKYLFNNPGYQQSVISKLSDLFNDFYKIFGFNLIFCIVLFTIISIILSVKIKKTASLFNLRIVWLIIGIVLSTICLFRFWSYDNIGFIIMPISIIGFSGFFVGGRKLDISIYLYMIGLFFALSVQCASNNSIRGSAHSLIFSTIAVILYCSKWKIWNKKDTEYCLITRITRIIGIITCCFFLFFVTFVRMKLIYRDNIKGEISRITFGPAAGIYTTTKSVIKYQDIYVAIMSNLSNEGTIFFTKLLPFGYLCSNLKPATPSLWRTALDSLSLSDWLALHPESFPNFVFVVNEKYGISNAENTIEGSLFEHIKNNNYSTVDLQSGTIYIKNLEKR